MEWARVPRVNLLPQEITDDRHFYRMRRVLAVAVVGVGVLCALATVWAQSGIGGQQAQLDAVRSEASTLQRQQAKFAEVPRVSAELETDRTARAAALDTDVLWYRFLTDLAVNTPEGAVLKSVTITMSAPTTASTSGGSAAATGSGATSSSAAAGLGTVKVSGEANRFVDVAAWLDAAGRVNGLVGTTLQSAVRGEAGAAAGGKVTYSGGASISSAALSHRYDRKAS